MSRVAAFLCLAIAVSGSPVLAHGGGLNAEGCHHNRKTGDYHCHRAPVIAPKSTLDGKGAATGRDTSEKLAAQQPGAPKCYVGPRGGTYTITKSGRKNYGGC